MYPEPGRIIFEALGAKFGQDNVRHDIRIERSGVFDFPVLEHDGRVSSAMIASDALSMIPGVAVDCVYIHLEYLERALNFLETRRDALLKEAASRGGEE